MAKQIARLLKTDVMADIDIPAIAQFLQSQGRRGDTILAHINAKEAELLKMMGGAEERNPVTGLPEYYTIDSNYVSGADPYSSTNEPNSDKFYTYQPPRQGNDLYEAATFDLDARKSPFYGEYGGTLTPDTPTTLTPSDIDPTSYYDGRSYQGSAFDISNASPEARLQALQNLNIKTGGTNLAGTLTPNITIPERPSSITFGPASSAARDKADLEFTRERGAPGIMDKASAYTGLSKEALARLGLAGIGTYQGIMAAREASEQGRKARRETEALARPYQQRGEALIQQAQAGELTAAGQQQLQALRARLAQGAEGRGGVGAAQAAAQVEAFRQNLLQNQFDYGQKISNIGDQLMLGAIRTGLEADRYAAGLSNTYFTNMASIAAGLPVSAPIPSRGEQ